jgi:hypothetical protein
MTLSSRAIGVAEMTEPEAPQVFGRIVTDAQVAAALDYLRDSADAIGKARGRLVKSGHMIKHTEALLLLQSEQKSIESRKAEARCSERWLKAIDEEEAATIEFEKLKALREAASAKVDAWRSESANYRGMRV